MAQKDGTVSKHVRTSAQILAAVTKSSSVGQKFTSGSLANPVHPISDRIMVIPK